jgi:hypothetical protein
MLFKKRFYCEAILILFLPDLRPEILKMALGFPLVTNPRSCHTGIPLESG